MTVNFHTIIQIQNPIKSPMNLFSNIIPKNLFRKPVGLWKLIDFLLFSSACSSIISHRLDMNLSDRDKAQS